MSYEIPTIDQWIYETLSNDATLQGLLAVENKPNNYQQGVYNMIAPQVDLVSRKPVQTPYIVFSSTTQSVIERSLCNGRFLTDSGYRITVWDTASGAVSMAQSAAIMSRIDTLLDNQHVSSTSPRFYCRRESTAQTFGLESGGRTDFGVTAVYRFVTQQ